MTAGGWINLVLAIGTVTLVLGWCIWRVLSRSRADHELGHVEPIEEKDIEQR
jgi:hypothetical protein